jgi:hypothetical protein
MHSNTVVLQKEVLHTPIQHPACLTHNIKQLQGSIRVTGATATDYVRHEQHQASTLKCKNASVHSSVVL